MKYKSIYICVAVLTFATGAFFASTSIKKNQPSVKTEALVFTETLSAAPPAKKTILPPKNFSEKPKFLNAVEIKRFDPDFESPEIKLEELSDKPIVFDLELGQTIENQMIVLHPNPNDAREFKIEQQFKTSMTVSDEGPHLDLTDWKHYRSEWKEITKLEGDKFLTSKIGESEAQRFPQVTSEEIYKIVLKNGGKRWANLARSCKTVGDGACSVGVNEISFRIMAKENGKWSVIHKMIFSVPMGC